MIDVAQAMIEEESESESSKHGGSRKGRLANLPRNFEAGYQQLLRDYFCESPVYGDNLF
jgi:hypothetical protein